MTAKTKSEHRCPADHKHGQTSTCYNTHRCRCPECRTSKGCDRRGYDWENRRRQGRDVWIPATGTMRRLQALAVIGWSPADIAPRMDSHYRPLQRIRAGEREQVRISTARRVGVVYEALCMRVRDDRAARIVKFHALEKGWVPPLAWDDIDADPAPPARGEAVVDPLAIDLAIKGEPVRLTPAERRVAITRLHADRWSDPRIAERLRLDDRSVLRIRHELGLKAFDNTELIERGAA